MEDEYAEKTSTVIFFITRACVFLRISSYWLFSKPLLFWPSARFP